MDAGESDLINTGETFQFRNQLGLLSFRKTQPITGVSLNVTLLS